MTRVEGHGLSDEVLCRRHIRVGILAVILFLSILLLGPLPAETCGWWGDGEDDDDVIWVGADGESLPDDDVFVEGPAEQTRIGNRFRKGEGVARNYKEALLWYRRAADQGFAGARNNLANMYENGIGVLKDYAEAARWYQMSAEEGNAYAQHSLGIMYMEGRGVPQDYAKAAHWMLKAAEQGHHGAFRDMGNMYWKGLGVEKNHIMAYMWIKLAVLHGDKESEGVLTTVSEGMPPASIAKAERMAHQWKPKSN